MSAMTIPNFAKVARNGIPSMVVMRRSLLWGDHIYDVGEEFPGADVEVTKNRMRALYEQKRITPAFPFPSPTARANALESNAPESRSSKAGKPLAEKASVEKPSSSRFSKSKFGSL